MNRDLQVRSSWISICHRIKYVHTLIALAKNYPSWTIPFQLQQELLAARRELETQATQILSLEAALLARPVLPQDAPEDEKDKMLSDQARTIRELDIVVKGYEDNLGEPLRKVKEDVEREWMAKVEKEVKVREEKEAWAELLVKQLEKEKRVRAITPFLSRTQYRC